MKKGIGLLIMLAICVVLDFTLAKGIGSNIPEHLREYLWQSFSGSAVDWICIILLNVLWLATAIMQVKEVELYSKNSTPWFFGFLGLSLLFLMLIRYA